MFEESEPPVDLDFAPWEVEDDCLPPLPPVPADLFEGLDPVTQARLWELDADATEAELARSSPLERFEQEYGYTPDQDSPEFVVFGGLPSQEVAIAAQDLAVQANRVRWIADARRIAALLTAYERSIDDLAARFGSKIGAAEGMGGQAFCRTFGLLTKSHPNHVAAEVSAGRTLRDRLPGTWAVFQAGDTSWARARTVVTQSDGLDQEHWPEFDAKAASAVVSSNRLKDDLRKARERLQDDTAAKRARSTHERRRTSLELGADSGVALVVEGLATDWVPVNDALQKAAVAAHGTDPRQRTVAQLRHDIVLDILHEGLRQPPRVGEEQHEPLVPVRKPVEVTLILTVPALAWLGRTTEQAQLGGFGPIDLETAKDLAGTAKSFVRVLTHPFTGARLAMDRTVYSPPADLARWVRIRDGRSRFPGSIRPAHLCDIDHAREWQHDGRTEDRNLVTLDRPVHNGKSAGLYQEQLEDSGIVGWTDAWRRRFDDPPGDPLDPAPRDLLPPPRPPDVPADDDTTPF